MKTNSTSLLSYWEEVANGNVETNRANVYNAIVKLRNATDREIAHYMNCSDPNIVRPRRFELLEQGLIYCKEKRKCLISKKLSKAWEVL